MKDGGVSTHRPEQLPGNPASPRSSGLLPWTGILAGQARLPGEQSRSPEPGDGCVQVSGPTDGKGVLKWEKLPVRGTQRYPNHREGLLFENQQQEETDFDSIQPELCSGEVFSHLTFWCLGFFLIGIKLTFTIYFSTNHSFFPTF